MSKKKGNLPPKANKTASKRAGSLTDKQRAFCAEYLIDLNAAQAAIRAGYSPATAQQIGSENLSKPVIQLEIQRLMEERANRVQVSAERVLQELKVMAFYDPAAIAGAPMSGPADIVNLPEEVRRCIIGWGWDKAGNFTLKLASKTQQLELLGRHLRLFSDKLEITGKDGGPLQTETSMSPEAEKDIADCMAAVRASLKPPGS